MENNLTVPQNIKHTVTTQPNKSTPRYIPTINEDICPHQTLSTDIHSSIIYITKRWKLHKCPSTEEWIDKMLYPWSGILYSNKKKLSADMGYVDKSWNILLNERSHSQRTTDCTVSLIWNAQNRKDYVDRNYIALGKVGPLEELWDWGEGVKAKRVWWDFGGEGNKTVLKLWWWMINSLII